METDIKKYIEEQIPSLKGHIYPVFTTDLSETSLAYFFSPVSGGHLKESELELRIIGKDYDSCMEIKKNLDAILDMEEDEPFRVSGKTRFHSGASGGGILFNDAVQMYENTVFYLIKWRKVNG